MHQSSAVSLVFGALSSVWAGTISVLLAKVEHAWAWWTWLHIWAGPYLLCSAPRKGARYSRQRVFTVDKGS